VTALLAVLAVAVGTQVARRVLFRWYGGPSVPGTAERAYTRPTGPVPVVYTTALPEGVEVDATLRVSSRDADAIRAQAQRDIDAFLAETRKIEP
jgi:hypothetical protein